MKPILEAIDVHKAYANHVALSGVSLEIPEGSIFGLLGPNGAGKTSLIRIITQITGADEGEIRFRGERLNPGHIAQIGYLPGITIGEPEKKMGQKGAKVADVHFDDVPSPSRY